MSKVSRGEALLNKWAHDPRIALSESGKDWLLAALDPFHDTQLKNLQGWPDVEVSASVVRCIKKTLQIAVPSGGVIPANTNWDCHIALFPWLYSQSFDVTTTRHNDVAIYNSGAAASQSLGGLVAQATAVGSPASWPIPTGGLISICGSVTLDDAFTQGPGRLIGIGFEVTDTTAELYRQGTCTVWRQPQPPRSSSAITILDSVGAANDSLYALSGNFLRAPPTTIADAMLHAGSRQWAARDGAYVVGCFHSNENPPYSVDYVSPIILPAASDDLGGSTTDNNTNFYFPSANFNVSRAVGAFTQYLVGTPPQHLNPMHQCGVILSGINYNASFNIAVNFYYESFPSISEKDILVLATPSCEFDPVALNLYSHAMSVMPVGVPVAENAAGDWF